jgi:methylthioribose-1-phosphate isomerase
MSGLEPEKIVRLVVDLCAASRDTANKIGTYRVAVLAAHHEIPFYVVSPTSTLDRATPDGSGVNRPPYEESLA